MLQHSTEIGIVSFAKVNGTQSLSEKQIKILEIIISRYKKTECIICVEELSWNEILDAEDNSGLCSYHAHQLSKD